MSAINGDKARFNRERKKKIAQRLRNRKMIEGIEEPSKAPKAVHAKPPAERS